jgi:hypothetical protein
MAAKAEQPIAAPRRAEFRGQSEQVEKLAAKLDQCGDPEVRAAALELVQSVVELHGAALQRLIDRCVETAEGERVLTAALEDNLVSGMFLLHSLHPDDIETRVVSSGLSCTVLAAVVRPLPSPSKTQSRKRCTTLLLTFLKLLRRMPRPRMRRLQSWLFSNKEKPHGESERSAPHAFQYSPHTAGRGDRQAGGSLRGRCHGNQR